MIAAYNNSRTIAEFRDKGVLDEIQTDITTTAATSISCSYDNIQQTCTTCMPLSINEHFNLACVACV